jgi:hypothetical protein
VGIGTTGDARLHTSGPEMPQIHCHASYETEAKNARF